jgi:hypothetical protein
MSFTHAFLEDGTPISGAIVGPSVEQVHLMVYLQINQIQTQLILMQVQHIVL